jgi:hypothetical protein
MSLFCAPHPTAKIQQTTSAELGSFEFLHHVAEQASASPKPTLSSKLQLNDIKQFYGSIVGKFAVTNHLASRPGLPSPLRCGHLTLKRADHVHVLYTDHVIRKSHSTNLHCKLTDQRSLQSLSDMLHKARWSPREITRTFRIIRLLCIRSNVLQFNSYACPAFGGLQLVRFGQLWPWILSRLAIAPIMAKLDLLLRGTAGSVS